MEAYGYREILESVLEHTGGAHMINTGRAAGFLGVADRKTLYRMIPRFKHQNPLPVEIFVKDLCAYAGGKEAERGA